MFSRLLSLAILLSVGYWYWSGPYQSQYNPTPQQKLEQDIGQMRECIRGMNYSLGATGVVEGDPETVCAGKFNLYLYEGEWRSLSELDREY